MGTTIKARSLKRKSNHMLQVDNVNLFYGAAQALRSVSISATIGRVTCVLGRNGVGKTSLMRAIVGHQAIRDGGIKWEGEELSGLPAFIRARKGLGYVPQGREIFPLLTVKENLMTGVVGLPRDQRVIDDEVFSLFPILREMMGRRGGDLSGGQQQQLAIARALLTKPKLLILDEPTEGIQPNIVHEIGDVITRLCSAGLTVLLVEQKLPFARRVATDVRILDKGRLVVAGKIAELTDDLVQKHLTV
jgi:urea transport system ATP-binding protein